VKNKMSKKQDNPQDLEFIKHHVKDVEESILTTKCSPVSVEHKGKLYSCTTNVAMHYIGGKWKTVILIHLINSPKRYNELHKLIPTLNERTLSIQLKQMEEDGLISRKVYTDKSPLKVIYSLTEFGKTLIPCILSIAKWGYDMVNKT